MRGKAGLGRPSQVLRPHMEKVLRAGGEEGWDPIEIPRSDTAIPADVEMIIISTDLTHQKGDPGTTVSLNFEWRDVLVAFRKRDGTIPMVLTTSGAIPIDMMQAMLAAGMKLESKDDIDLVEIEERAEENPKLGLPTTFVLIKKSDIVAEKGEEEVKTDLICRILKSHVKNRRSS